MTYLTFLAAILLSGIAAYYSIIGLAAIFVGAFWPVVFMASSMEFAKLVTASWVYRNWKTAPKLLLFYLTTSIVVLMLITSMGIFGFLAKAHIDSTLDAGANTVELKTLSTQQKIAEERLNYLLARAKDPSTASNRLDNQIQQTQKELTEINRKRLPLLKEENKLVADIGPIKYVADMFFEGDSAVDKAVRLVILLIMLVFDPLAVLLLIAGNISLKQREVVVENGLVTAFRTETTVEPTKEEIRNPRNIEDDQPTSQKVEESVQVEKTNLVAIEQENESNEEEKPEPIVIDSALSETIPPIKKRGFPNRKTKEIDSKYDEKSELAFREKQNEGLDGGNF